MRRPNSYLNRPVSLSWPGVPPFSSSCSMHTCYHTSMPWTWERVVGKSAKQLRNELLRRQWAREDELRKLRDEQENREFIELRPWRELARRGLM